MFTKMASRQEGAGGSKEPEDRALPADVSNRLGLVDFGNNEEVQALRAAGIEVINSERKRIEALNVLYDEMFSPAKRIAELKAIMGKNFIGPEHYQELFPEMELGEIPEIPDKLTDQLLNGDCKLWPGQKVKETHILAYVPTESIVDFIERANNKKAATFWTNNLDWVKGQAFATDKPAKGQWILMPKDIVPGTTSQTDKQQIREMAKYPDYITANANPLAIAIAMNYLVNDERIYTELARCAEEPSAGKRAVFGGFYASGLRVYCYADTYDNDYFGRAAFWNLQK